MAGLGANGAIDVWERYVVLLDVGLSLDPGPFYHAMHSV